MRENHINDKKLVFIIKTSFDCNMGCTYCYEGHRPKVHRMVTQTVDNLISKVGKLACDTEANISFVWHGGEPLLMGKEFYTHLSEAQKVFGSAFHVQNMLQTNGLLLDNAFAKVLADNNIGVGISLDGPPVIHDAQRPTKIGNKPSFKQVYEAFIRMDKLNKRPGALAIFTRNTYEHLDEFYEFFRDRELDVKINPLLKLGSATDDKAKDLSVTPKEFGEALIHLFDRWISEPDDTFSMDPFEEIVRSFVSGRNKSCVFSGQCANFFKVYPDGNLYLCGRLPFEDHGLGNINTDDIQKILRSPVRQRYAFDKAAVRESCGKCEHFDICNGGCTNSAYTRRQNVSDRNYYCEGYKVLFNHIKAVLPKQATFKGGQDLTCYM